MSKRLQKWPLDGAICHRDGRYARANWEATLLKTIMRKLVHSQWEHIRLYSNSWVGRRWARPNTQSFRSKRQQLRSRAANRRCVCRRSTATHYTANESGRQKMPHLIAMHRTSGRYSDMNMCTISSSVNRDDNNPYRLYLYKNNESGQPHTHT